MGLTVKYKLKKTWSFKITPYLYTRKWYQGNRPPVDRNKFCLRLLLLFPSCSGFPFPCLPLPNYIYRHVQVAGCEPGQVSWAGAALGTHWGPWGPPVWPQTVPPPARPCPVALPEPTAPPLFLGPAPERDTQNLFAGVWMCWSKWRNLMNDFFSQARAVCFYSPYKKIGNKLNKPSHTQSSHIFFIPGILSQLTLF